MKRFLQKAPVFAACLVPLAWLVWAGLAGRLGANPISEITNETGTWTLRFLVITLTITPLRRLTGWNALVRFRRMLGLFAARVPTQKFNGYGDQVAGLYTGLDLAKNY